MVSTRTSQHLVTGKDPVTATGGLSQVNIFSHHRQILDRSPVPWWWPTDEPCGQEWDEPTVRDGSWPPDEWQPTGIDGIDLYVQSFLGPVKQWRSLEDRPSRKIRSCKHGLRSTTTHELPRCEDQDPTSLGDERERERENFLSVDELWMPWSRAIARRVSL